MYMYIIYILLQCNRLDAAKLLGEKCITALLKV